MSDTIVRHIVGPTILLQSGSYFDLLDPGSSAFTIEDVAHGLSHLCRFTGQCARFYSVAEHSVRASFIVPPEHAYAALLHDAAEAFVGDVSKPLKALLPEYVALEKRIESAVLARLGVSLPLAPCIRDADIRMLRTEQAQLMSNNDDWAYTYGLDPLDIRIGCWVPEIAKRRFLERFETLRAEVRS